MIREFLLKDLDTVMKIWLDTNINAHDFISEDFWIKNFDLVKEILPKSEVYVYELENKIQGFVGISDGYIAGIFVSDDMRSKGIGKLLLGKCKDKYKNLSLSVYEKNKRAIEFYKREGFIIKKEQLDENTCEKEYYMVWSE
ncbi:MAG: Acetyltransferase domain [Anaerocolumna sp.]|jgi:putative acetyltransferase|nr:Acetyltransferase domain [Anaerocolumna sp.]